MAEYVPDLERESVTQCGKPDGTVGWKTIEEMNEEHHAQIEWGLEHLPEISPSRILDIGCGGGIFTRYILERYPDCSGCAIDISETSVRYSREFNSGFISDGRLDVQLGNVVEMPYGDGSFDLVVSNASHFFWPGLEHCFREVARTMRKGAVLLLTSGLHVEERNIATYKPLADRGMNIVLDSDLLVLLEEAGIEAECFVEPVEGYGAYVGTKI